MDGQIGSSGIETLDEGRSEDATSRARVQEPYRLALRNTRQTSDDASGQDRGEVLTSGRLFGGVEPCQCGRASLLCAFKQCHATRLRVHADAPAH